MHYHPICGLADSQCKLVSGRRLRKRRSALLYGPRGSERILRVQARAHTSVLIKQASTCKQVKKAGKKNANLHNMHIVQRN